MNAPYLEPLTPFPRRVRENGLIGELNVRYNAKDNYIVIFFKYKRKDHYPAPLVVHVEVSGKRYRHVLFISDYTNRMATTDIFTPEYNVWEGMHLYRISPLLTYGQKLAEGAAFGPSLLGLLSGKGK
ncbi:MAG: hypothetical protein LBP76_12875 [Treponema sp.]|jgi:hypothetical protein|nr:hypothetical protein [Treponema sp.]